MSRWGKARRDVSQSIPDHIDTYRARSEFLELRTHARRLTDENERLRHRLAGCLGRKSLGRGAASTSLGRSPRRPQRRAAASPARVPAAPAVDAGVKDLIKNYRRALRRADARAVDLQARAQAAEARAVAAERRAAAAELRAAEAEAREADALPPAPTQEVPRAAAPPAAPQPLPQTPDTPDSDDGVAAALRDEVSNLDAEIDVLRGALRAAGDRVTAASLEERAREAARAILAASSRR